MDQKLTELRDFAALMHRPTVRAAPRAKAKATAHGSVPRHRKPPLQLPEFDLPALRLHIGRLPLPRARLWINVGCGLVSLLIVSSATWLALPPRHPTRQAVAAPLSVPVAVAPVAPPVVLGKLQTLPPLPTDDTEVDEQGEMTTPDPVDTADAAETVVPAPLPEIRVAALPPPPLPQARQGEPAWLHFAVPAAHAEGRPRIAVVIDDLGLDKKRTERTIVLPGPLTLSFLAYATDLPRLTGEARRAGHELLVHVPMEPLSRAEDMGPNGLAVGLGSDEVLRRLRWDLDRFAGYVGINNHMGSRFTSDAASMAPVMEELRARGLLFLDSRTIGNSAGGELARRLGVPHAARDVFLDNDISAGAIAAQLAEVEQIARRHGSAIAIGHPHDATIAQLRTWLAGLASRGFTLVPVSAIVREHWHGGDGETG
jgi:polysaccharide deacetylase 2 family uncharacterized protein YibQ